MISIVGVPLAEVTGPAFAADRTRYVVMGSSVCVTAAFSFVALTAALTLATGQFTPAYLAAALVWALFIFNLDRWVVSVVDHESGWRSRLRGFGLTVCRLVLAVLIGLSISVPIEMLIFRPELAVEIDRMRTAERDAAVAAVRQDVAYDPNRTTEAAELAVAEESLTRARQDVGTANNALDNELSGASGTGDPGEGRRSRQRERDLYLANNALAGAESAATAARSRFDLRATERKNAQAGAEERVRDDIARRSTGLIDRAKALESLSRDRAVNAIAWLVRGLILLVDVSPVLLKLVSPHTLYDSTRPKRAASAQRMNTVRIEADEAMAKARIRGRATEELVQIDVTTGIATERIARSGDITLRKIRAKHADSIREGGLAQPSRRMLTNTAPAYGWSRKLSLVRNDGSTAATRQRTDPGPRSRLTRIE